MTTHVARAESAFADDTQRKAAATFGMWVFLATELVFFGPLFVAYTYARLHASPGFIAASRHTDVMLGTLNTSLLLTSSALVALAAVAAKEDTRRLMRGLLCATVLLGLAFLVIKGFEYHADWQAHLVPGRGFHLKGLDQHAQGGAEMFFFLYFVMTGIHAIHMLVGIGLLGTFALHWRNAAFITAERVEIGALYWHFVDVIWIFLYPLLYLVERHT